MPARRLQAAWLHPARLPLAAGWEGTCTAPGHEGEIPESFEACNLGYAAECPRLPRERSCDAVRFAVVQESESRALLIYVCEKDHRPAEYGNLEFRTQGRECPQPHPDPCIQRMAECFLAARKESI